MKKNINKSKMKVYASSLLQRLGCTIIENHDENDTGTNSCRGLKLSSYQPRSSPFFPRRSLSYHPPMQLPSPEADVSQFQL